MCGYACLEDEYIRTSKNEMSKYHYKNLAFTDWGDNRWILRIKKFEMRHCHIKSGCV